LIILIITFIFGAIFNFWRSDPDLFIYDFFTVALLLIVLWLVITVISIIFQLITASKTFADYYIEMFDHHLLIHSHPDTSIKIPYKQIASVKPIPSDADNNHLMKIRDKRNVIPKTYTTFAKKENLIRIDLSPPLKSKGRSKRKYDTAFLDVDDMEEFKRIVKRGGA